MLEGGATDVVAVATTGGGGLEGEAVGHGL